MLFLSEADALGGFNMVSVYLTRNFLTLVSVLLAFKSRRHLNHDLEVPLCTAVERFWARRPFGRGIARPRGESEWVELTAMAVDVPTHPKGASSFKNIDGQFRSCVRMIGRLRREQNS